MLYLSNCKNGQGQNITGRTWNPVIDLASSSLPLINARPSFVYANKGSKKLIIEPHLPSTANDQTTGNGLGIGVNYGMALASDCYLKADSGGHVTTSGSRALCVVNEDVYDAFPSMPHRFSNNVSMDGCVALGYLARLPLSIDGYTTYKHYYDSFRFSLDVSTSPTKSIYSAYTFGFSSIINQVAFVYCWRCEPVGLQVCDLQLSSTSSSFVNFRTSNTTGLDIISSSDASGIKKDGGVVKIGIVPVNGRQYDVYSVWSSQNVIGSRSAIDSLHVVSNPIVWFKNNASTTDLRMEAFISYAAIEVISDK